MGLSIGPYQYEYQISILLRGGGGGGGGGGAKWTGAAGFTATL